MKDYQGYEESWRALNGIIRGVGSEMHLKRLYELVQKNTPKEPINIQYNTHGLS